MMKNLFFLLLLIVIACNAQKKPNSTCTIDNKELTAMYSDDQSEREANIDPLELLTNDQKRRTRTMELMDSGAVATAKDHFHAAMIFQHGTDSVYYKLAMDLMKTATSMDSTINKWLLAAATDRYLISIGQPQIYGTQYYKTKGNPWYQPTIDTTIITDEERISFGVETLEQQRSKLKELNSTAISH